ncbi:hypothetical protein ACFX2G_022998 [Malus domestica]
MREIVEFKGQIQEQSELPNSTIVNSMGDFEITEAITLGSAMEIGDGLKMSKHSLEEEKKLLIEEEEDTPTAREEQPLPQALKASMPCNSGNVVPNSILSNPIPPNVPFPRRFMISKEEENEKDILEALPNVQKKEVDGRYQEFTKEAVHETTKPKEVEFYDTGQVLTITFNLAKSNLPETFKEVVFVIEFLSDKAKFEPMPDHFKYHLPFKDQFHAMGPRGV